MRAIVEVIEWTCDGCGRTTDTELVSTPKGWKVGPPEDLCPRCRTVVLGVTEGAPNG